MIGPFIRPQKQWERNVVRMWAAVCGEKRCVTRQRTAARETRSRHVYRHCLILKFLFRFQFFCSCTSQSRQESHCSWPEPWFRGAGQKERGSGDENGLHPNEQVYMHFNIKRVEKVVLRRKKAKMGKTHCFTCFKMPPHLRWSTTIFCQLPHMRTTISPDLWIVYIPLNRSTCILTLKESKKSC